MKYFVDAGKRAASGHENYIEFQTPNATEEFWDETSLYMLEAVMDETGFGEFWSCCMQDGIVFDMASFSKDELSQMANEAAKCGGTVLSVITELKAWADTQLTEESRIAVSWASDRALASRRAQREAYSVDPKFYQEVQAMLEHYEDVPLFEWFAVTEETYEELLRKYDMPDCFFPFPLY